MPIGQTGLKNGSKIMMLGKKVNAAEDSLIQGIGVVMKKCVQKIRK